LGIIFLNISLFSPAVLTYLLLSINPGEFVDDVADKLGDGGGRRGEAEGEGEGAEEEGIRGVDGVVREVDRARGVCCIEDEEEVRRCDVGGTLVEVERDKGIGGGNMALSLSSRFGGAIRGEGLGVERSCGIGEFGRREAEEVDCVLR